MTAGKPERALEIARAELGGLFEEILAKGADLRVSVTGQSMRPFIRSGATLTISPVRAEHLRVGDVVVFKGRDAAPVIHRLVAIRRDAGGSAVLQTKGDATVMLDEPVRPEQVLGRVTKIEEGGSVVNLDAAFQRAMGGLRARLTLAKSRLLLGWSRLRGND